MRLQTPLAVPVTAAVHSVHVTLYEYVVLQKQHNRRRHRVETLVGDKFYYEYIVHSLELICVKIVIIDFRMRIINCAFLYKYDKKQLGSFII